MLKRVARFGIIKFRRLAGDHLRRGSMIRVLTRSHTFACCLAGMLIATLGLGAQSQAKYRDFQLGASLASISSLSGVPSSQAKVISERPAMVQELEWRPSYFVSGSSNRQTDPVDRIAFSFFNDKLFRLVVDYDRQRTDGLTDRDMIDAIAAVYGAPVPSNTKSAAGSSSAMERESGTPISRWGDVDYSVVLFRTPYSSTFRLVVTSSKLDSQARNAAAEALRLDAREAPQRELARQQKEAADTRVSQEKAREANKATFRP